MTKRKIFLLAANLILLCICITQWILNSKSNVRIFVTKESPDEIIINNAGNEFTLVLEGEDWFVGEQKYPAANNVVEPMAEAFAAIKALDKVGTASSEAMLDRYELNDGQKIMVTAKKEGKVLRTLNIGKETSVGSQVYATVDEGKDIYILAGNLKYFFDKGVTNLRSSVVLNLENDLINSVSVKMEGKEPWALSRTGKGSESAWSLSGSEVELDSEKALVWFENISPILATQWYGENADLPGNKIVSAEIGYGEEKISVDFYEIPLEGEEAASLYYGTSSATPYTFAVAGYNVNKFLKTPEDMSK